MALAVWASCAAVLVATHEPWRDEADAWLLVRDAPVGEIAGRMAYAGTPGLWYVLLFPLARLGFPYASMQWLHWGLAVAAVGVLLHRAPFRLEARILLVFSYYLLFEYAVVSRSYVLSVLLLFALAANHERRLSRPVSYGVLIALLANTNVHSLVFAACVGALFLADSVRRGCVLRTIRGLAVATAGGIAAVAQLLPPADGAQHAPVTPLWSAASDSLRGAFLPLYDWAGALPFALAIVGLASYTVERCATRLLLLLWGGWGGLFLIFVFRYPGFPRHHGLLLIFLIFVLWLVRLECPQLAHRAPSRLLGALLATALVFSTGVAALRGWQEVAFAFSGSAEAAAFLRSLPQDGLPIAAHTPPRAEAVLAHLDSDRRFWYAAHRRFGSYMTWDEEYQKALEMPGTEAFAGAAAEFPGGMIFVSDERIDAVAGRFGYELVFVNRVRVFAARDERYFIYAPAGGSRAE
jgi:hypothetical protein